MHKKKIVSIMTTPLSSICIALVYIYKGTISKILPDTCRFVPTCSTYMIESIREWGIKGIGIGIKRLFRCRPHGKTGEDWVPFNIKGDKKWIF